MESTIRTRMRNASSCSTPYCSQLPRTAAISHAQTIRTGSLRRFASSNAKASALSAGAEPTKSTCTGACAIEWPPLRAPGKPTVGGGANASVVATSARSDGKPQVTYNGHPLYLFSADQKAGDTNGQGVNAFGGLWYVLSSSGNQITTSAGSGGGFG